VEILGPASIKRAEVRALVEARAVSYSPRALNDDSVLAAALSRCDSLVHLRYRPVFGSNPRQQLVGEVMNNLLPSIGLLAAARSAGIGHICFASSTAVYPAPACGVTEDAPAGGPVSPYALIKVAQEASVRRWSRLTGRPAAILRLATVYGAGETVDRAIPNFIRAALRGRAPRVDGHGMQPFDPVHVDDVADAFVRALHTRADGTFNIGTGAAHTPREVAELIVRLCGADCKVEENHSVPDRGGPISDVSRALSVLGFRARIPLTVGLKGEVAWFRGTYEGREVAV
jgi:UDP-glucose 4-epimerase